MKEFYIDAIARCPTLTKLSGSLMSILTECTIDFKQDTVALYVERALVEKLRGVRVEIRINEHAPPHFHVVGNGHDASFAIKDCEHIAGNISSRDLHYLRYWYFDLGAKEKLIEFWNNSRPSNCPVGPISRLEPIAGDR